MRMTFLGGAGTVTGSCYALEVAGRTILLDCGQFQGTRAEEARNREPLPIDVGAIAAVVLSHAHIDHSGRLPLLGSLSPRRPFRFSTRKNAPPTKSATTSTSVQSSRPTARAATSPPGRTAPTS